MDTITISKKEYKELKAVKARLQALSNVKLRKTDQTENTPV